jgi:hypothetical protein
MINTLRITGFLIPPSHYVSEPVQLIVNQTFLNKIDDTHDWQLFEIGTKERYYKGHLFYSIKNINITDSVGKKLASKIRELEYRRNHPKKELPKLFPDHEAYTEAIEKRSHAENGCPICQVDSVEVQNSLDLTKCALCKLF